MAAPLCVGVAAEGARAIAGPKQLGSYSTPRPACKVSTQPPLAHLAALKFPKLRNWTFAERTKHSPLSSQSPWSLRDWRLVRLMFTRFVAANPSSLVCLLWGIGGGIVSARDTTPICPAHGRGRGQHGWAIRFARRWGIARGNTCHAPLQLLCNSPRRRGQGCQLTRRMSVPPIADVWLSCLKDPQSANSGHQSGRYSLDHTGPAWLAR